MCELAISISVIFSLAKYGLAKIGASARFFLLPGALEHKGN